MQDFDQAQFVLDERHHLVRHTLEIAARCTFPGELSERLLRRQAGQHLLLWILVGEFVEGEAALARNFDRASERFGVARKQSCHLLGRLEIAVGMALAPDP